MSETKNRSIKIGKGYCEGSDNSAQFAAEVNYLPQATSSAGEASSCHSSWTFSC